MVGFFAHSLPIEPIFVGLGGSGELLFLLPHFLACFPRWPLAVTGGLASLPKLSPSPDTFMAQGKVSIFMTQKINKIRAFTTAI